MKHPSDACIHQSNLLQALQKNKVIQGKLTECQRSYYVQLVKDLQNYHLKEKYNRELLYTWKKESYVRQLKKNLQEYEQKKTFDTNDPFYEYQVRSLDNIIIGHQSLTIPPSEEERRLNINEKYHQFLQKNPLQKFTSARVAKSENISPSVESESKDELENIRGVEETWKHIHAQSAHVRRRKQSNILPNIHRSATINEIRRSRASAKTSIPPRTRITSSVPVITTTMEVVLSSSDEKFQRSPRSPRKPSPIHFGLSDGVEPLLITSEALDKYTRADLITMRSVRRPRKNPTDLNLLFETRKRICQINKQALDHQVCQRQWRLQTNLLMDHVRNLPNDTNENTQKQQDNTIVI